MWLQLPYPWWWRKIEGWTKGTYCQGQILRWCWACSRGASMGGEAPHGSSLTAIQICISRYFDSRQVQMMSVPPISHSCSFWLCTIWVLLENQTSGSQEPFIPMQYICFPSWSASQGFWLPWCLVTQCFHAILLLFPVLQIQTSEMILKMPAGDLTSVLESK